MKLAAEQGRQLPRSPCLKKTASLCFGKDMHASCSTPATYANIAITTSLPLTRPPGSFKTHLPAQSVTATHCGRRTRVAGAHAWVFSAHEYVQFTTTSRGKRGRLRILKHDAGGGLTSHALSSQQKHIRLQESHVTICDAMVSLKNERTSGLPRPRGMSSGVMMILKT